MAGSRTIGSAARDLTIVLALIGIGVALVYGFLRRKPQSAAPATQPAVSVGAPVSQASGPAAVQAAPVVNWMDVVLREHPTFPTTRPLAYPVDFADAARLVVSAPVYLCPRGDLWITHPDAPSTANVLRAAPREQTHVVRDRVRYVHWAVTETGVGYATLVLEDGAGGYALADASGRRVIDGRRDYQWDQAFGWNDRIVVPTREGVAIVSPTSGQAQYQPLCDDATPRPTEAPPARALLDRRGVLAWLPGAAGRPPGWVARHLDGVWHRLDGANSDWPAGVMEVFPLLDGTALVLSVTGDDRGGGRLSSVVLGPQDATPVDARAVERLVEQLSADEQPARDSAMAELSRYGPGAWDILERLRPHQPAEAQQRLDELLTARQHPSLGVLRPVADDLRVASRLRDGGVVLYSDAGVEVPRAGAEPGVIAPAWIAMRPGRAATLLPAALTVDAVAGHTKLVAWGDEWVVQDPVAGPKRYLGNHLRRTLKPSERAFSRFAGIDSRGRWLFADDATGRTLVIDPFLPDPTPRLPVWTIRIENGDVGWSDKDWPVTRRGGAWALLEDRWEPLPDSAPVHVEAPARRPNPPATTQSDGAPPLLTEPDDTRWYGGVAALRRVGTDGAARDLVLPPEAVGDARTYPHPVLIRAEGALFLLNAPGRVLRLRERHGGAGPDLVLEATFTRDIPNVERPARVWLDPAGRIVIATGGDTLSILFPGGRIPPEIRQMMPADENAAEEPDVPGPD